MRPIVSCAFLSRIHGRVCHFYCTLLPYTTYPNFNATHSSVPYVSTDCVMRSFSEPCANTSTSFVISHWTNQDQRCVRGTVVYLVVILTRSIVPERSLSYQLRAERLQHILRIVLTNKFYLEALSHAVGFLQRLNVHVPIFSLDNNKWIVTTFENAILFSLLV